ncbi:MAG: thiamine diphosphokinase [Solobacterium sp.]|nr:thiamine diphosphokinase [Solobacterium sp.]
MSTALIALRLTDSLPDIQADYIGADAGALVLAKKKKRMVLAVGDFDSVSDEEMNLIREYADKVIVLNPIKDDTDSESALNHVLELGYDHIVMCGALGRREDHSLVNLRLVYKHPGVLSLYDQNNLIEAYEEGTYTFAKDEWKYISFFTFAHAVITLENMKYPLDHRTLTPEDLYTLSNEITEEEGILHVLEGKVLVIRSHD